MSLRRENTAPPRFYGTSPAKRQPRASFTPPQQRAHQVIRRGSLGVIQSNSAEKKLLFSKRSNSLGGANDDYSPTKLDFQSLKKRPSLLGTGKLKSGNKETEAVSNRAEKHSMVILGAGGVGKTGKHSNVELSLKSLQTHLYFRHNLELHSSSEGCISWWVDINGITFECVVRGTQREHSSKPLKHSTVKRILVFKR